MPASSNSRSQSTRPDCSNALRIIIKPYLFGPIAKRVALTLSKRTAASASARAKTFDQYESLEMTSPPAGLMSETKTEGAVDCFIKCTDPSAKTWFAPPGWNDKPHCCCLNPCAAGCRRRRYYAGRDQTKMRPATSDWRLVVSLLTDASPSSLRMPMHSLGPMWFAIPSSCRTFTDYSLPVSRRSAKYCRHRRTMQKARAEQEDPSGLARPTRANFWINRRFRRESSSGYARAHRMANQFAGD